MGRYLIEFVRFFLPRKLQNNHMGRNRHQNAYRFVKTSPPLKAREMKNLRILFTVSDSRLWGCRPKAVHRVFLILSFLVTFHKNIFSTFKTNICVLQCTPKATIFGRRLVLLPEDCDLRLHRNPAMEILERRTYL